MEQPQLTVHPESELRFQISSPRQSITLTNVSVVSLAFKVKTTAPRHFSVRPSAGTLAPGANCVVQVLLQIKDAADVEYSRKDKFLIQSVQIPPEIMKDPELNARITELWAHAEASKNNGIMAQTKLRCILIPPDAGDVSLGKGNSLGKTLAVEEDSLNRKTPRTLTPEEDSLKKVLGRPSVDAEDASLSTRSLERTPSLDALKKTALAKTPTKYEFAENHHGDDGTISLIR